MRRSPVGADSAAPELTYPRSWSFAALLAALAMLGPFAIDMYLPAFHAIALEFEVSQITVQQSLSTYLFAYAFMMLRHGALSDALGRRPVVLASLAIYAFASLGCAIKGNIQSLWLFRTHCKAYRRAPVSSWDVRSFAIAITVRRRRV